MKICSIDGCNRPRKYLRTGWCGAHDQRNRRTGSPHVIRTQRAETANGWKGDEITYGGAHRRIERWRGRAGSHSCACGAPAAQWAYDHEDPNERTELAPGGPRAYSPDPAHYAAMCVPCHKLADLERLNKRKAVAF